MNVSVRAENLPNPGPRPSSSGYKIIYRCFHSNPFKFYANPNIRPPKFNWTAGLGRSMELDQTFTGNGDKPHNKSQALEIGWPHGAPVDHKLEWDWSKFCKGKTFPLSILLLYLRAWGGLSGWGQYDKRCRQTRTVAGGRVRGLQSARKFIPFESHPGIKSNTI